MYEYNLKAMLERITVYPPATLLVLLSWYAGHPCLLQMDVLSVLYTLTGRSVANLTAT